MENKRKLERKQTGAYVGVFDTRTNANIGCIIDVTTAGLRLMSTKSIPTDRLYSLRIEIQIDILSSKFIVLEAKSVWCRKNEETRLYDVGFIIKTLSEDNLLRLEQWMEHPCFIRSDQPTQKPQG